MEVPELRPEVEHRIRVFLKADEALNAKRPPAVTVGLGGHSLDEHGIALEQHVCVHALDRKPDVRQRGRSVLETELAVDDRLLHRPAHVDVRHERPVRLLESRDERLENADIYAVGAKISPN